MAESTRTANSWLLQKLCGGRSVAVDEMVCNPANRAEIERTLEENGFVVLRRNITQPALRRLR